MEKRNLQGKFGPTSLNESGDYGTITSHGPFVASADFTVEVIKVNGPGKLGGSVKILESGKFNGPLVVDGDFTGNFVKVNGPMKIGGIIAIEEQLKVNGPSSGEVLTGESNAEATFNGPVVFGAISSISKIIVHGPIQAKKISDVSTARLEGRVEVEAIEDVDSLKISLTDDKSGITRIGTISAGEIEIGRDLDDPDFHGIHGFEFRLFKGAFKKRITRDEGYAEIAEIRAKGKVELDHVKVDRVFAKELFVGEETEVGEFIEVKDELSASSA
ncbi:MAG TPA: hypothetical protein VJ044_14875 [Candidatus Hodarchaeales archaeon]|nr:hypothetical protein [Candidatus Hodarchaeales archaeon]